MKSYVPAILALTAVFYLSVGLDISILRECLTIFYLTFVPGFVVLKAIKVDHGKIDTILYSAGLSIAILMFLGLAINLFGSILPGFIPLSLVPLTAGVSGFTLLVLFTACRKDLTEKAEPNSVLGEVKKSTFLRGIVLFLIPLLGIVGALSDNSFLLAVMIIAIGCLFGFCLYSKIVPEQLYFLVIFAVSIALLFHTSLISNYLMGWDIHLEDNIFRSVMSAGSWKPLPVGVNSDVARFESLLSITILPTIYSLISGSSQEVIFKITYPLIFALLPLALYQTYKAQLDKKIALLAVFFFMATPYGFSDPEILSLARQMVGELFLVLSVCLIVDTKIPTSKKWPLFIIFGAALAVSHYALSYLYVLFLLLALVMLRKWNSRDLLNVTTVLTIFGITFAWYTYVSDAPLLKLEADVRRIYNNFSADLLNPQARSAAVSTLAAAPPSIVSVIHRSIFYLEIGLMVLGIALFILKRKKTPYNPVYGVMAVASMAIMIMCIAIPAFAASLQMTRFYGITLLFLAPFFVTGGVATVGWIYNSARPMSRKLHFKLRISEKNLAIFLISIILIAGFLFDIGLIDHLTNGYPSSPSLDGQKMRVSSDLNIRIGYYYLFIPSQDVFGAKWLATYRDKKWNVYSDDDAKSSVLLSYAPGLVPSGQIYPALTYAASENQGLLYLRYVNTVEGIIVTSIFANTTEISSSVNSSNLVYSNGATEIFKFSG
jgi:uncharacterized membrane protein